MEYSQELLKIILQLHVIETPTQMFSCEYWDISKNTYLEDHLNMATFEVTLGSDHFQNHTELYYKNTCYFQTRTLFKFNPYTLF